MSTIPLVFKSSLDLSLFPKNPGCFIIRGKEDEILFVGKGINLRERITQFLGAMPLARGSQRPHRRYLEIRQQLLDRMQSIEVILTHGEEESTPLVNRLILRWQPLFNLATFIELDPGSYIYLTREEYPRLLPIGEKRAHKTAANGALDNQASAVFGPFPGGPVRDLILKIINEHFQLRTCSPLPERACFLAEINACSAPCEGRLSPQQYARTVINACQILASSPVDLLSGLEHIIEVENKRSNTRHALRLRSQVDQIGRGYSHLPIFTKPDHDLDALFACMGLAVIVQVRSGSLSFVEFVRAPMVELSVCVPEFACQYYQAKHPPAEILLPSKVHLPTLRCEMETSAICPVKLTTAETGREAVLLDIARINHRFRTSPSYPG